jgi:hypothetical protein
MDAFRLSRSEIVLPTQKTIDCLAERIERAYTLRHSQWYRGCSTPRVWSAAAMLLWQVHREDCEIPLDPELFVASQPLTDTFVDPWSTLAHPEAGRRYQQRVRRIIRRLRAELRREIRRAEEQVSEGRGLTTILRAHDSRLSPLGLYITAHRVGRPDLADRLRVEAVEQHNCCPLYRSASLAFLPADLYPVANADEKLELKGNKETPCKMALLN